MRKQWCWGLALGLAGITAVAEEQNIKAEIRVGEAAGTKDTITVVQPNTGGGQTVIQREVVAEPAVPKARVQAPTIDDSSRKARVAVVPAVFTQELRSKFQRELGEKFGVTDLGVVENPGYTSYVIDALVNSRKLDVLERENLGAVIKELDFGESDYADVAKVVKMGRMLNADYVVVPEIRYLSLTLENKEVPFINQKQALVKGKFATNVRVVDVATGKIVASNIGDVQKQIRLKEANGPAGRQIYDFIEELYGVSGKIEAANVIDTAYPIKVVAVAGGALTINRGKGAIVLGEVLEVYQAGEMMTDPDTKENLGFHETKVGKAKVVEVNEKTAKAEVLESAGEIPRLSICRRVKALGAVTPVEPPAPKLD
jgi:hypothetical protein